MFRALQPRWLEELGQEAVAAALISVFFLSVPVDAWWEVCLSAVLLGEKMNSLIEAKHLFLLHSRRQGLQWKGLCWGGPLWTGSSGPPVSSENH